MLRRIRVTRRIHIKSTKNGTETDDVVADIGDKPFGVFRSWMSLRPVDRLAVVLSFTSIGLLGLHVIGDVDSNNTGSVVDDENGGNPITRFFRWTLEMAEKEKEQSGKG